MKGRGSSLVCRWVQTVVLSAALGAAGLGSAKQNPPPGVVVKPGEHLSLLGKRYGVSVAQLKRWNGLIDSVIHPGQRLRVRPPATSFSVKLVHRPVLKVPLLAVHVNLAHPLVSIRPLLPPPGVGRGGEVLQRLAWRTRLVAAINGGYFHPRTFWPAGDLVVGGHHLVKGSIPTALAITPDKRARVVVGPQTWRGYETVIANGPYILRGGRLVVRPRAEGYNDPAIWRRARRSAVGVVNERYLIFVSTKMELTLCELGKVMAKLGAKETIVLDGGSSTGLVWKGQTLIRPARALSYGIGVFVGAQRARG
ncbi:MAG: peptidoglycan-binding protein [Meiothermus sp.]